MALPLVPLFWIGAAAATGYALDRAGNAGEGAAEALKWGAVAGGVYVSWRALQAGGVLK